MDERKVQKEQQKCNIFIEDRRRLTVTAVEDIDTFDESGFIALTSSGALVVKGTDLHINKLNVDTGELVVDGMSRTGSNDASLDRFANQGQVANNV